MVLLEVFVRFNSLDGPVYYRSIAVAKEKQNAFTYHNAVGREDWTVDAVVELRAHMPYLDLKGAGARCLEDEGYFDIYVEDSLTQEEYWQHVRLAKGEPAPLPTTKPRRLELQ